MGALEAKRLGMVATVAASTAMVVVLVAETSLTKPQVRAEIVSRNMTRTREDPRSLHESDQRQLLAHKRKLRLPNQRNRPSTSCRSTTMFHQRRLPKTAPTLAQARPHLWTMGSDLWGDTLPTMMTLTISSLRRQIQRHPLNHLFPLHTHQVLHLPCQLFLGKVQTSEICQAYLLRSLTTRYRAQLVQVPRPALTLPRRQHLITTSACPPPSLKRHSQQHLPRLKLNHKDQRARITKLPPQIISLQSLRHSPHSLPLRYLLAVHALPSPQSIPFQVINLSLRNRPPPVGMHLARCGLQHRRLQALKSLQ